jgi:hypothetical protein
LRPPHAARDQALAAVPAETTAEHLKLFRRGVTAGLSEVRRVPGAKSKQRRYSSTPSGIPAGPLRRLALAATPRILDPVADGQADDPVQDEQCDHR